MLEATALTIGAGEEAQRIKAEGPLLRKPWKRVEHMLSIFTFQVHDCMLAPQSSPKEHSTPCMHTQIEALSACFILCVAGKRLGSSLAYVYVFVCMC